MHELGKITAEERDAAQASGDHGHRQPDAERLRLDDDPWGFCDYFARWWNEQADFGKDIGERNGTSARAAPARSSPR